MKRLINLTFMLFCILSVFGQEKVSVSILGDSYSTFEGYLTPDTMITWYQRGKALYDRTDVVKVSDTWWMQVIKRMGWKLDVNNSWSGSTVCNTGYNKEDYTHESFVTRVSYLGSPDVIFVFGGTNDSWAESPIGDYMYKEWSAKDLFFFRPAMCYLIANLQKHYPTAELYVISNTELKEDVTLSIAEICKHYGVKIIQLDNIDKLTGHPSVKGMGQIADQIVQAIKHKKMEPIL